MIHHYELEVTEDGGQSWEYVARFDTKPSFEVLRYALDADNEDDRAETVNQLLEYGETEDMWEGRPTSQQYRLTTETY